MKPVLSLATAALLFLGSATAAFAANEETAPDWEAMSLAELRTAHEAEPRPWQKILDRGDMVAGIYRLAAGAEDRQPVHGDDEVYHVLSGKGVLVVGNDRIPAEAGSILYVARHVPHRFVEITEPLEVLVIFAKHDRD